MIWESIGIFYVVKQKHITYNFFESSQVFLVYGFKSFKYDNIAFKVSPFNKENMNETVTASVSFCNLLRLLSTNARTKQTARAQ